MHKRYLKNNPDLPVSYPFYRKMLKDELNISLKGQDNDKCPYCLRNELHKQEEDCPGDDCSTCKDYKIHRAAYRLARKTYDEDREIAEASPDIEVITTDMKQIDSIPGKIFLSFEMYMIV